MSRIDDPESWWWLTRGCILILLSLSLSSCSGRTKIGVCAPVPGFPGQVCFDLDYQGATKRVTVPRSVVEDSPTVTDE